MHGAGRPRSCSGSSFLSNDGTTTARPGKCRIGSIATIQPGWIDQCRSSYRPQGVPMATRQLTSRSTEIHAAVSAQHVVASVECLDGGMYAGRKAVSQQTRSTRLSGPTINRHGARAGTGVGGTQHIRQSRPSARFGGYRGSDRGHGRESHRCSGGGLRQTSRPAPQPYQRCRRAWIIRGKPRGCSLLAFRAVFGRELGGHSALLLGWRRSRSIRHGEDPARSGTGVQAA
jgi:hypothetical protein